MSRPKQQLRVNINEFEINKWKGIFNKILVNKNEQLQIARKIYPEITPSENMVHAVGEYIKSNVINHALTALKAAEVLGYDGEYSKMIKLESNLPEEYNVLSKYITYDKSTDKFIKSKDFETGIKELFSLYITNSEAISVYKKTEKFIKLWEELMQESYLDDVTRRGYGLSREFGLVRWSQSKNRLEPNYITIKKYMDI